MSVRNLRYLLPSGGGSILLLALPIAVYGVVLKARRLIKRPEVFQVDGRPVGFEWLGLFTSDVLMPLGAILLMAGTLAACRGRRSEAAVLTAMQLVLLFVIWALTGAHGFFLASGSAMDFLQFAHVLEHIGEMGPMIDHGTSLGMLLPPLLLSLAVVLVPWVVRHGYRRTTGAVAPETASERSSPWLPAGAMWIGGVLGLCLAGRPWLDQVDPAVTRDPLANLAATAVTAWKQRPATRQVPAARLAARSLEVMRPDSERAPNIALILLESTRARSVTPYRPDAGVTPFFDELASQSMWVEQAYAVVPHTSKALVAILCGIEPLLHLELSEAKSGGIPARCLPELLEEAGYQSVYLQAATSQFEERAALIANMGFEDFIPGDQMPTEGFERGNYFGYEDAIMLEPSRTWIEQRDPRQPFFATYLTNTPHHDYRAPSRYGIERLAEDETLDRYLNSVRYVDGFVEELMEQYRALGVHDDTVFIIVADHGEGFGEHGQWLHDDIMYDEVLRIPFMVYDPTGRRFPPQRITGPANHLDVLPTALEAADLDVVAGAYLGASISSLPAQRALFASCLTPVRCLARIDGQHKYVHHFGRRPDELFDIHNDPDELRNRAEGHPRLLSWREDAVRWRDEAMALHRLSARADDSTCRKTALSGFRNCK